MPKVSRFEELVVWQKARAFTSKFYQISADGAFSKDFSLKDQIRRATISISSNIAEGFERNGNREFKQFLSIAKASLGEVRSLLYLASDLEYISKNQSDILIFEIGEISKMISGLISYLKNSESTGSKFYSEKV